jgi:hypothetical protein
MTDSLPAAHTIGTSRPHRAAAGEGATMRPITIIRPVVLALALAAMSAPAAWADSGQPLIVPDQSTEHVSPSAGSQPLIVPVRPSTEHGGAVAAPPPVVIVRPGGFDWASAGIGAVSAAGLAAIALAVAAMYGRRTHTA